MPRGNLARAHEERAMKQRAQAANTAEIKAFFQEQRTFDAATRSLERCNNISKQRQTIEAAYEAEQQQLAALQKAKLDARIAKEKENEQAEAEEFSRQDALRRNKTKQHIIENNPELQELRRKLAASQVDFTRHQQRHQGSAAQISAELDELKEYQAEQQIQQTKDQKLYNEKLCKLKDGEVYRSALLAQIAADVKLKEAAQQEVEKDRVWMQGLVDKANREVLEDRQKRLQNIHSFQAEVHALAAKQQEFQAARKAAEKQEDDKLAQYIKLCREREERESAAKAMSKENDDREYLEQRQAIEAEQAQRDEEEALLELLHAERQRQRLVHEERERQARKKEQSKDLLDYALYARRLKAERAALEVQEEAEFKRRLMEKISADAHSANQSAAARRQMMNQCVKKTESAVMYRRKLQAALKAEEEALQQREVEKKQEEAVIVAAEKKRLLEASKECLRAGFVPKGVLQSREELQSILQ